MKIVRTGEVTYAEGQGIITDISQVGGYPEYHGEPYADADSDGMPDDWESAHGLNPNDAADAAGDLNGDGYTNIEESRPLGDPKAPATAQAESVWHFPVEDDNPNVDAFNPCLPNEMSPACPRHPVTTYAPYADGSPPATFNSWPRP